MRAAARFFGLALFALAAAPLFGDVTLDDILKASGGTLAWEPDLGYGVITRGENILVFKPDMTWALLNYAEKVPTGELRRAPDGGILFNAAAARAVEAALAGNEDIRAPAPTGDIAAGAGRSSSVAASRIAAIVIDPGHGGKDPGTSHTHVFDGKTVDVVEKKITLKVALDLYAELKARYPGLKIVLTRTTDTYVSLEQRTIIANSVPLAPNEAMIFVSIHANASFDYGAKGYEAWYLPPTYSRDLIDPNSLGETTKELYPILNSMREEEYTIESVLLGKKILEGIQGVVKGAEIDRGLKEEPWFVVRNAKMPAVLVELGFVTNPEEARLLIDDAYLKKLATGLYNGISSFVSYFDSTSGFTE